MKKLIIIFFSLAFIASNCEKAGEDCHLKILIKNNSSNDIMYGWNIRNTSGDCILDVSTIRPNEIYELRNSTDALKF